MAKKKTVRLIVEEGDEFAGGLGIADEIIVRVGEKEVRFRKVKEKYDPGPCYRCHTWPCSCPEGPLMERPR